MAYTFLCTQMGIPNPQVGVGRVHRVRNMHAVTVVLGDSELSLITRSEQ